MTKRFWWAIIAGAVLVGLVYGLPQLLIWKKLADQGKAYQVIQLTHHSDEAYGHSGFAREIYDGHFPPGDLFFNQNTPSLFSSFPIPYMLMAFFLFLYAGSLNAAYAAAHFIVPAALFGLFVWLGRVLTKNNYWAIAVGFVGVLTPIVNHVPDAFRSFANFLNIVVKNFYPLIKTPLPDLFLGRTMDPLFTYLIFIPAIIFLIIFWRTPTRKSAIIAGVAAGALYYTYFHYWVYLTIVIGLLAGIIFFWRAHFAEHWRVVRWFVGIAALVTVPYWINFFRYMSLPHAQEVTDGLGTMDYGHSLRLFEPFSVAFDYLFYIFLAVVVYWHWWRGRGVEQRHGAVLYWVFLAAMFIAWNVQVVVGYVPQPDHWLRTFSPFLFVIGLHALYDAMKRFNQRLVVLVLIGLSVLLVVKKINNVFIFVNPPAQFLAEYSMNSSIVDSWTWINENIPGEPVIASPSFVSSLYFNTETAARPYLATRVNSGVSNAVLEERFLKTFKAFTVPSVMVERLLRSDSKELCAGFVDCTIPNTNDTQNWLKVPRNLYSSYYRNRIDLDAEPLYRYIPQEKVAELVARYQALPVISFADLEAVYVYYGPWEQHFTKLDLSNNPDLEIVYTNAEVEVYRIKR